MQFRSNQYRAFVTIWLICLVFSLYGLYISVSGGLSSAGGLTVGLRIVLSLGTVLFPLFTDKDELLDQIIVIVKFSVILFMLGLLNGQWLWITAAFPAFLIFSNEKKIWKFLGFLALTIILVLGFTFTLKFVAITSFILLLSLNKKTLTSFLIKTNLRRTLLFFLPIFFILFIVYYPQRQGKAEKNIEEDRLYSKVYVDRGNIWKYSLNLILHSNFFVVPAGRDIQVLDYTTRGKDKLGIGAHNIFLEMGRQLGLFVTVLLTLQIGYFLINSLKNVRRNPIIYKFTLALFAVFMVFGLSGNSLIYDGEGFLFWLIVGQIFQINSIFYQNEELPIEKNMNVNFANTQVIM